MAQMVAGLGFAPQLPEAQRALAINDNSGGTSSALASPGPDTSLDTPSFGTNPLGALGYLLQSFSAGMQGQPLPGERLQQRRMQQQQMAFQQIQMSMQVADVLDKLPDENKQSVIDKFTPTLKQAGIDPAFIDSIVKAGPDKRAMLQDVLGDKELATTFYKMAGGDITKALALADSDVGKNLIHSHLGDTISEKMSTLQQALPQLDPSGTVQKAFSDGITIGEVQLINGKLPEGVRLTPGELAYLQSPDSKSLRTQLGFADEEFDTKLKQEEQLATARARVEARFRAPAAPADLVTLDLPDGTKKTFRKNDPTIDEALATGATESRKEATPQTQNIVIPGKPAQAYIVGTPEWEKAIKTEGAVVSGLNVSSLDELGVQNKEKADFRKQMASGMSALDLMDRMRGQLKSGKTFTGVVSTSVRLIDSAVSQLKEGAKALGKDDDALLKPEDYNIDTKMFGSEAAASQGFKANVVNLAYALARARNGGAANLSNQDVQKQIDSLGVGSGSTGQILAAFDEVENSIRGDIGNNASILKMEDAVPDRLKKKQLGAGDQDQTDTSSVPYLKAGDNAAYTALKPGQKYHHPDDPPDKFRIKKGQ